MFFAGSHDVIERPGKQCMAIYALPHTCTSARGAYISLEPSHSSQHIYSSECAYSACYFRGRGGRLQWQRPSLIRGAPCEQTRRAGPGSACHHQIDEVGDDERRKSDEGRRGTVHAAQRASARHFLIEIGRTLVGLEHLLR